MCMLILALLVSQLFVREADSCFIFVIILCISA